VVLVRSRQLEIALTEFIEAAAQHLRAELQAGAEVPFELGSQSARGGGPALYCYRPLTGAFLAERWEALTALAGYSPAAHLLEGFQGLDRYLLAHDPGSGRKAGRLARGARAHVALRALLEDVFAEQSDFELREEKFAGALERLDCSAHASASEVLLLATLHGLAIASPELPLTAGLTIARPDALAGLPDGALTAVADAGGEAGEPLIVAFATEDTDTLAAVERGREVLGELLRALRLFGDGRIALGRLAWARVGTGPWGPLPLSWGGRPHGMLVVAAEQEDELRAFCNLVSRRTPQGNELAWALGRFEMGCERPTEQQALSDYLLALRVLLEPEGPSSGLLAGRLAALCARPPERQALIERVIQAAALERATIAGTALAHAGADTLVRELANHLRALLRDVVCGHLDPDLVAVAEELLAPTELSTEELTGDPVQAGEVVDVLVEVGH
jgi:hypothetical protein